jgi:hypothetical protein
MVTCNFLQHRERERERESSSILILITVTLMPFDFLLKYGVC